MKEKQWASKGWKLAIGVQGFLNKELLVVEEQLMAKDQQVWDLKRSSQLMERLVDKELEVKSLKKKHKSSSLYRDWEANFHAISRLPWAAAMTTSKMGAWWGRIEKDRDLLLTPP
jgi:hypothetical protein